MKNGLSGRTVWTVVHYRPDGSADEFLGVYSGPKKALRFLEERVTGSMAWNDYFYYMEAETATGHRYIIHSDVIDAEEARG